MATKVATKKYKALFLCSAAKYVLPVDRKLDACRIFININIETDKHMYSCMHVSLKHRTFSPLLLKSNIITNYNIENTSYIYSQCKR